LFQWFRVQVEDVDFNKRFSSGTGKLINPTPALSALGLRGSDMRGLISVVTFAACLAAPVIASAQEVEPAAPEAAAPAGAAAGDPWEGLNRNLYAVHEGVDNAVLEPVARGYRAVTPGPVRGGVRNFLRNLRGPVILANDILQGEVGRAGTTAGRFAINTTIGIAGVFDPATSMGLERHDEDFGQTLAVWGVPEGPYVFVPLLGPSNVRDSAGRIVDVVFDPLTWAEFDDVNSVRAARTVTAGIATREAVIEAVDDVRENSLDPYVSIRSSYTLLRQSAIQNGRDDVPDLPEFDDDIPDSQEAPPAPEAGANEQHTELNQTPDQDVVLAVDETVSTSAQH
jgi:phospholipid-binding lipoprotein MlaA